MKNLQKILFLFSIPFVMQACMPAESCKNCEVVTYDKASGSVVNREDAVEYCGDDLVSKENSDPTLIGGDSIVWECN